MSASWDGTRVVGVGVDSSPGVADERADAALADALDGFPLPETLDDAGLVLLLPDTGYPHHPSTGAVTDPAVVRALAARIRRTADPDRVLVGVAGDGQVGDRRTAELLGYGAPAADPETAGRGAEAAEPGSRHRDGDDADATAPAVVAREDLDASERTVETHLGRVAVEVPALLEAATVVVVPSLRIAPDLRLAGASATLGRWLAGGRPSAPEAAAGAAAVGAAATVVDATTAYAGHPLATGVLFGGAATTAVDATAASLFGWDADDVPYLPPGAAAVPIEGVDADALRRSLPRKPSEESGEPGEAMATAYRAYARVTGDVVPPQFIGGDDA
ncbi:hypothetical protein [Halobaculum sp. EA56]|uniref:hypothetical protein n=1 Tax=Halobaculum sp. EA56 TaxID=3421648 RepID=UPI003EB6E536